MKIDMTKNEYCTLLYISDWILYSLIILIILTTTPVMADQCLSASQITITEDSANKFTVNLPEGSGYTYPWHGLTIKETGPISFAGAQVEMTVSNPDSKTGVTTKPINCGYGVDEKSISGQYPGGVFFITKDNSQNKTITLSGRWYFDPALFVYRCIDLRGQESACSFTLLD
jgi:hypothetical protein